MLEKIIKIIAEKLCIEENEITLETSLKEDLKADSLDLVEIVMTVEEEFQLEITDEDASNIKTVQDIVNYIEKNVEK